MGDQTRGGHSVHIRQRRQERRGRGQLKRLGGDGLGGDGLGGDGLGGLEMKENHGTSYVLIRQQ